MGVLGRRSSPRTIVALNAATFIVFQKQVSVAGTPERLHTDLEIPDGYHLQIKAESSNTGNIQVGHSSTAADDPVIAFILDANETLPAPLKIRNAKDVWLDVTVNGDGVECVVEQD